MQICYMQGADALIMPVTPGSYNWMTGKRMETINISQLGDVFRPGGRARFNGELEFLLPAQEYPFLEAGTRADPQYYIDELNEMAASNEPVRLIVTGTDVNVLVYIEEVDVSERDGTRDRYATVTMREYVDLIAVETVLAGGRGTGNGARPSAGQGELQGGTGGSYTIVRGDTLSAICRRYYGGSSAKYYNALAEYNGIKNPHLIYPGTTITIPPQSTLLGVGA